MHPKTFLQLKALDQFYLLEGSGLIVRQPLLFCTTLQFSGIYLRVDQMAQVNVRW